MDKKGDEKTGKEHILRMRTLKHEPRLINSKQMETRRHELETDTGDETRNETLFTKLCVGLDPISLAMKPANKAEQKSVAGISMLDKQTNTRPAMPDI